MTVMRKTAAIVLALSLCFGFSGLVQAQNELETEIGLETELEAESEQQIEKIEIHYFYDEACATCNAVEEFYEVFREELGDVSELYPYSLATYNVFHKSDAVIRDAEFKRLGYGEEFSGILTYPVMTINGRLYMGHDTIRDSLREAYLTAGEDLFEYGRGVFDPSEEQTLAQLLESYELEEGSSSIVYFYRIVCEECIETKEAVIDRLPETITADGVTYPQQVVRINTRSGRNSEVIQAFFEAYNVPEEDQMVPIVFTAEGYLAGYDAISANLLTELEAGAGLGLKYPEETE